MEPVELLEWNIQFLGKLLPILKQKLFAFVWKRLPPGLAME
jgi:hypothetical protein